MFLNCHISYTKSPRSTIELINFFSKILAIRNIKLNEENKKNKNAISADK